MTQEHENRQETCTPSPLLKHPLQHVILVFSHFEPEHMCGSVDRYQTETRANFSSLQNPSTSPPGNMIKYINCRFHRPLTILSGLDICVSIRMKNWRNEKQNGVPKPRFTETPATWMDCNLRPHRTSHMIANVSTCQQNSSLEQLIYIIAPVQRQNIWKQVCSLVHQLYRRIGNKRALKENEDQYKENCFAARKTWQCTRRIHGMPRRWVLWEGASLFHLPLIR